MTPQVKVRRRYEWAVLPCRELPNVPTTAIELRYLAGVREEEHCGPFQLGKAIGFQLQSPIDVVLDPLDEVQFRCDLDQVEKFSSENGLVEVWKRDEGYIGFRQRNRFRLYEYSVGDHWEGMFIPNGKNTVEWRLGFDMFTSSELGMLVAPPAEPLPGLKVPYGYLSSSVLDRMTKGAGFSLAVEPQQRVRISRGDILARVIPVPQETLKTSLTIE
jgi:hypothetical protein